MEYATVNPFANVRRKTPPQRKVVWTEDDVRQFLDTAYGEFQWRSIGLIVHMAYEWCQRLGDMRLLTWDNIDLEERKLYLEQSKRRAEVTLPIEDDLLEMLTQQEQDFGFQQYVVPRTTPVQGEYHPYSMERLSKAGRAVMREAGLSEELRLMDLRRTGTTQMVEAGVPMGQIMSVTGHSNPQSVKPYMKNTYASANSALTARKSHGKST
jgi:integrase